MYYDKNNLFNLMMDESSDNLLDLDQVEDIYPDPESGLALGDHMDDDEDIINSVDEDELEIVEESYNLLYESADKDDEDDDKDKKKSSKKSKKSKDDDEDKEDDPDDDLDIDDDFDYDTEVDDEGDDKDKKKSSKKSKKSKSKDDDEDEEDDSDDDEDEDKKEDKEKELTENYLFNLQESGVNFDFVLAESITFNESGVRLLCDNGNYFITDYDVLKVCEHYDFKYNLTDTLNMISESHDVPLHRLYIVSEAKGTQKVDILEKSTDVIRKMGSPLKNVANTIDKRFKKKKIQHKGRKKAIKK